MTFPSTARNEVDARALRAPRCIPGPLPRRGLGWRGNVLHFLRDPVSVLTQMQRQYGEVVAFARGYEHWVAGFGPRANRAILTNANAYHVDPIPAPIPERSALSRLKRSIAFVDGDVHRRQRVLLIPAFRKECLEIHQRAVVEVAERVLSTWKAGERLNISQVMHDLTLQIILRALVGRIGTEHAAIGAQLARWQRMIADPRVLLLPVAFPGLPFWRLENLSLSIEKTIVALITAARSSEEAGNDILSLMSASLGDRSPNEEGWAADEITANVMLLMLAGHETSSNVLTWTLFLLSQHPRLVDDLREEVWSVLRGSPPSFEDARRLALLERAVSESMRILPPLVYNTRRVVEAVELCGYELAPGTKIVWSPYVTHHMPELYDEPEEFRPDRWCSNGPKADTYLPFGLGPHGCIGGHFASMSVTTILAMILQRTALVMADGAVIDRKVKLTLTPSQGMPMIVADRAKKVPVRGNIHEMVRLGA